MKCVIDIRGMEKKELYKYMKMYKKFVEKYYEQMERVEDLIEMREREIKCARSEEERSMW